MDMNDYRIKEPTVKDEFDEIDDIYSYKYVHIYMNIFNKDWQLKFTWLRIRKTISVINNLFEFFARF